MSSAHYRLITNALDDYSKETGVEIVEHPFTIQLQVVDSPDDILRHFEAKANAFEVYRDGNHKLMNWLVPVVQVIHGLSGVLGDAVSLMQFKPAQAIFVSVDVLITAADGINSSYDALVDLFYYIGSLFKRIQIYTHVLSTPVMTDMIVKIMIELLSVFAIATKQIKQGRFKNIAKKLLGQREIEAVLQRLDRLSQEEARMVAAQVLDVVYGLLSNLKVVMDDGKASIDGIRNSLGRCDATSCK
ncbi:hypothetical protein EI94DRAFT_1709496 [Lactarius quietus]|nr:hypothetical protein EI94DRAFT_1709496 [Lactarius quietus]